MINLFFQLLLGHIYSIFGLSVIKVLYSNSHIFKLIAFKNAFDRVKVMQKENGASIGKLINVANIITFSYACRRTIDFD